jgi:hypothetical protein
MTAKEIREQIESYKSQKSTAIGKVQVLQSNLEKYKKEYQDAVKECSEVYNCKPKDLSALIEQKHNNLETKLSEIETKLKVLQGD